VSPSGEPSRAPARTSVARKRYRLRAGDRVRCGVDPGLLYLFDAATQGAIGRW
jgi:hypothetical protein